MAIFSGYNGNLKTRSIQKNNPKSPRVFWDIYINVLNVNSSINMQYIYLAVDQMGLSIL
ncbi:MAG: hypothetical protein ACJASB_000893 [Shewanella psychromarinicola]|jgi:hypothetical protein